MTLTAILADVEAEPFVTYPRGCIFRQILMRAIAARLVLLPLLISVAFGFPAFGQTSVDMRALDQATAKKPAPKAVKPEPSTTAAPPAAKSAPSASGAAAPRQNTAKQPPPPSAPASSGTAFSGAAPAGAAPAGAAPSGAIPARASPAGATPAGSTSVTAPGIATGASKSAPTAPTPTRGAAKPKPTGKSAPAPATGTATKSTPSPPAIQAAAPPKLPIRAPDPAPATAKTPPPLLVAKPPEPVWLTFDSEKADIKPDAAAAITALVRAIPVHETASVNVAAYAAGRFDDPSTARRLSLSRGMAVRAALIDGGIPSTQIYVRALGAAAPDGGAADRVLLSVARTGVVSAAPDAATSGPNRKGTP